MASDSSLNSSNDSTCEGHHETWEDVTETQAKKILKLEKDLEELKLQNDHLEWHCCVYQDTLEKLDGMEELERTKDEYESREGPVCTHCRTEKLLKKIHTLEGKAKQSTAVEIQNESGTM
ncbi:uncharacterized protein LOC117653208 isoform X2 [Thrips palmi]|uniref:Uncharacterized protein LOC117653208 isoform X2 n=1 Tax=Thrips palmi TaxID=161013 RepID=A0A6P9A982_THRPL|nr:uncharacterized protein LOC117653208 isoform X2 [Thrips palmi]